MFQDFIHITRIHKSTLNYTHKYYDSIDICKSLLIDRQLGP